MKKYTKQQILTIAKKYNIEVDDDGLIVWVDAPRGYVFEGTDLHWIHVPYYDNRYTKSEVWEMVYLDICRGIEKCEDLECDLCREGSEKVKKI